MKAKLLTAAIALAATAAQAVEPLTKDEIAKLRFMTALAYAEAIDVYCFPGLALCHCRSCGRCKDASGAAEQVACRISIRRVKPPAS